jgi:molybdenum cofactor biosynthesis enzyme MoaA
MGRYSVALGKIGPTCNPNNPCSGKYGKCLDLKLTNECNGNCPFCIEAKGYSPQNTASAEKLAETINAQDIQTVLILGGEPLLYPDIVKLLSLIRKDLNIVLTTNGSLLTPDLASAMTPYIKGMNISIHHSTSAKHEELTKIKFNSETLYKSIHAFGANKIRINCNLVKGYVDTRSEAEAMCGMVRRLGVSKLRFAELQNCPALYVNARDIFVGFGGLSADPFKDGCEVPITYKPFDNMEVIVRVTCGLVDANKPPVVDPTGRNPQGQIMYSDLQMVDSWLDYNMQHSGGCH